MSKAKPVIARTYLQTSCLELVALGYGRWIVTVDGQVPDARRKLNRKEAQDWFDDAAYQIGKRP